MRITGFTAENFKRLKAVSIDPDTHEVVIAGRNAQGKSSVLDAIWAALAGKAGQKDLARPIREGEKKASVGITLDDLRVERKWTASGSTVTVSPRDGSVKFNSPQAILDKLIGSLSFDPLAFAEADAKTQRKMLLEATGMADALEQIEADRKASFDERTNINREIKRLHALLTDLKDDAAPVEKVDVEALLAEAEVALERANLQDEWRATKAELTRWEERLASIERRARVLPGSRDLAVVQDEVRNAAQINQAAARHERFTETATALEANERLASTRSSEIDMANQAKAELLATTDLPQGLSVDDDGVVLNGVPFVQASAAERLKVSVAVAMASNPEVRVICIKDASLLDSDSRATLNTLAVEFDFQLWLEVVGDGGPTGIIIEDGEVQA